jgi:bifunctional DNA-binding transcriptional regulator/antitoxin component of YhaV-PrlF toxin-antitoxin module
MEQAVIRKNHQLSLPPGLLKRLDLQPGQTFICIVKGDVISLVPKRDLQSLRGLLKGANIENYRDRDERV